MMTTRATSLSAPKPDDLVPRRTESGQAAVKVDGDLEYQEFIPRTSRAAQRIERIRNIKHGTVSFES